MFRSESRSRPRPARRRRAASRLAVVALAALAGLALLVWIGAHAASDSRDAVIPSAAPRASGPVDGVDPAAGRADGSPIDEAAADLPRERTLAPLDPLTLPDADELRALARRGRLRFVGYVLDAAGEAAPDVPLYVDGREVGRSDAGGAYAVEMVRDGEREAGGRLAARSTSLGVAVVNVGAPSRRIDLKLQHGATLRGKAIGWRSRDPVAGARVELRAAVELTAETAADGSFEIPALPAEPFALRAESPTGDTLAWREYSPLEEGKVREVLLELRAKVAVTGWFAPWPPHAGPGATNGSTRPLAKPWTVRAISDRTVTATPDADGRFELRLTEYGHWMLQLDAGPAQVLWVEELAIGPDSPPIEFGRIELRAPSVLFGRLPLPEGGGDPGLVVSGEATLGELRFPIEAEVAADGRFELGPCAMERCWLTLDVKTLATGDRTRADRSSCENDIAPGERRETRLTFDQPADPDRDIFAISQTLLLGRVVDEGHVPIAFAEVLFGVTHPEEGLLPWERVVTAADGRFALLVGLRTGTEATVRAAGGARRGERRFVLQPLVHALGDVVLGGGRVLRGKLLDPTGAPVVGSRIVLDDDWLGEWSDFTAHDGTVEFRGLEPRRYHPEAAFPDGYFPLPPLEPEVSEVTWPLAPEEDQ